MTIELICKGCGQKLRVPDEHAGKQARCPQCQTVTQVSASAAASSIEKSQAFSPTQSSWYMKTPDGKTYGPVDRLELDRWAAEGRLSVQCQLRDGDQGIWLPAAQVFPSLNSPQYASPAVNPFAEQTSQQTFNPYASPAGTGSAPRYYAPHRGGLILALAILGWAVCFPFSIAAWVMGAADIKAMNTGRMDPEGKTLTQVGMFIGIAQCVLTILVLIFVCAGTVGGGF